MRSFAKGDRGDEVVDIQVKLATLGYDLGSDGADGSFGDMTEDAVMEFQHDRGLAVTGIVDEETWRILVEATYKLGDRLLYLRSPFFKGDDVRELQMSLNALGFNTGKVDGVYGETTERAVREFQLNLGLTSDGIFGPSSFTAIRNLRHLLANQVSSIFPDPRREHPSAISIFQDKKIAIDHTLDEEEEQHLGDLAVEEAEVRWDLGLRLGNLLELLGAEVLFINEPGSDALSKDVDIYVGFVLNCSTNPGFCGSSVLFSNSKSEDINKSQYLAMFIQKEMTRSLGSKDLGIKAYDLELKLSDGTPSVVIKPLFITNPKEKSLLNEEVFRQKIAVAVFDGIKNYLQVY